ncbi:hypothetical protein BYT27DRAFT_7254142 [Phlegmacium glaucopus]|nr:hypothetical protein BYT27DRAFT_7254142 [Phlegmacium glaucopus]
MLLQQSLHDSVYMAQSPRIFNNDDRVKIRFAYRIANLWFSSGLRQFVLSVQRHGECLAYYADDIVPTVAPFSPASTAAVASQTSPSSTPSTLPNISLNPTGTITTTSTNLERRFFKFSAIQSIGHKQVSTTVPSTSFSVLTQIVTTARQGGSVATSEVTLFPTATSQASALPVSTVGEGKIIVSPQMGLSSDHVVLNMFQNRTTVATPFALGPPPSSSTDLNATLDSPRLPLFYVISEKSLRQQTRANRAVTDLKAASTPPDLAPSSNAPAFLVSAPSTHAQAVIYRINRH